jgi:hypothetical protein
MRALESHDNALRGAEPGSAGELVKAAIRRASRRLEWSFSRTKDIWYGDARRIHAQEMDWLRHTASVTAFANAVAAIESLRNQIVAPDSEATRRIVHGLNTALLALARNGDEVAGG